VNALKAEMSSFDIAVITAELNRLFSGFHIRNIYQLNPKTLLLSLSGKEGARGNLLMEAGKKVHSTSYALEKPLKPPSFCMALRKYLRNGVIEGIEQYEFERIVEIAVKSKGNLHRLVVELFGEGNIILVGPDNKILHALSYRRMRDRNILRGEELSYPPSVGKDPRSLQRIDLDELKRFGELEVAKAIARFLSVGGFYGEEILLRAGVPKESPCASLTTEDLDTILRSLQELLAVISDGHVEPCIFVNDEGGWIDVAPVQLKRYTALKCKKYGSFNAALDEYYAGISVGEKVQDAGDTADQELSRLKRILCDQEETVHESKKKAEMYRNAADAIYQHFNEIQSLLQRAMAEKRGGKSWREIAKELEKEKSESQVPAVYFEAFKLKTLAVQVSIEGQPFDLELKFSAQRNAAVYYERAKKEEKRAEGAEKAVEKTRLQIERAQLQKTVKVKTVSRPPRKKRKREWYEKFRWFRSSDGFFVIGGRDAATNEILIKKQVEPYDIVFHADIAGSPFALVKTGGAQMSEQTLKEAAQFTASYSRAWKEGLYALDVYWVHPEQVSKTPPSGEYLPRGSFMIYGTKTFVRGALLEVAVGLKKEDDNLRVIGGPPEAISSQTKTYVLLAPGRESSGKLAKQIRHKLAELASEEKRKEVLTVRLEEIQAFLPGGGGTLK
jgi:predicted ribosome quality control (RQC) complex YloA/Tae2 family protein